MSIHRICIIGRFDEWHVGAHLLTASNQLRLTAEILDVQKAWSSNQWVNRIFFHLGRHHPARLRQFDADAESVCRKFKPQLLLVTGISPPGAGALQKIGKLGVCRCNFLTDDPWNSKNGAGFFLKSLRHYDLVYSPRRSNLADLLQVGCQQVEYLPFGYNQELHFPELPQTPMERERFACDVAFVGCADYDRIPMALALVQAGLRVNLYGAYWDRYAKLRSHWKGLVFGRELRLAVGGATVNI